MDYNDIKTRLERLNSSINSRFDDDVIKHQEVKWRQTGNVTSVSVSFDKNLNVLEVENKILTILHNLANLKDNLKNSLSEKGGAGQDIENEINSSLHLQLILDLSNQEKHGYPLKKTRRSLRDPQIINVVQSLCMSANDPGSYSIYTFDPITGQTAMQGDCKTIIDAEIIDSAGISIMHLDELINKSMEKWEEVIKKYNIS